MRGPAVRGAISFVLLAVTLAACSVRATRTSSGSGVTVAASAPPPATPAATTSPQAAQGNVQAIGGRAGAMLTPGILVGNTLYLSGQLGGRAQRDSGVGPQTRSAITTAQGYLRQAGMELTNVVVVTVYLADIADFQAMNAAYNEMFTTDPKPTRTTVAVAGLVNNAKVEVTMVAVRK